MNRSLCVLVISALLLSACDKPVPPPHTSPEAVPDLSPPKLQPAPELAEPERLPPPPRAKVENKPKVTQRAPVQAPEPAVVEPPAALDLHLPDTVLNATGLAAAEELVNEPLLPPLFVEKEQVASPFQISGKLISNPHSKADDYFDTVEGAQLQIEFRN